LSQISLPRLSGFFSLKHLKLFGYVTIDMLLIRELRDRRRASLERSAACGARVYERTNCEMCCLGQWKGHQDQSIGRLDVSRTRAVDQSSSWQWFFLDNLATLEPG